MSSLLDRIINDPNSTFKEDDAAALAALPPEVLQRLAIGLQPQAVAVANEDGSSREVDLREDLQACQQDILSLLATEKDIRQELTGLSGTPQASVLEQILPVMNSAQGEVDEQAVADFVKNSQSVTAQVLREGLGARDANRAKAIDVIVSNSQLYTEAELRKKFTAELMKLADFVQQVRPAPQPEVAVYNWDGAGIADQSVSQSTARFEAPLELPSTFQ